MWIDGFVVNNSSLILEINAPMCCALELTLVDKDAVTSFQFWSHCGNSMVEELKKVKNFNCEND